MKIRTACALAVIFAVIFGSFLASEAVAADKKAVRAAMVEYIEAKTVDGVYLIENEATSLDYIHSGVSEEEGLYVSCADFKKAGDTYDIDYYVMEEDGKYVVVKEALHKRNGKKIGRVLWQQK